MVMGQLFGVERSRVEDVIVGWVVKRKLEFAQDRAQHDAQVFDPLPRNVLVLAGMVLGNDPGFERKAAGERRQNQEAARVQHDAAGRGQLLLDHVAINAAAAVVEKLERPGHLLPDRNWHDRRDDQLRVGVFQRRTGGGPLVFEDQSVHQARIALQVDQPVPIDPEHFADVVDRQVGHVRFMVRALDDDFVRADAVHQVVNSFAPLVEISLDLQSREFVRHDARPPAAVVALRPRMPISQNFRRRRVFVSFTKRAEPPAGRAILRGKVLGSFGAVGRQDHPASDDGVFSKFRHRASLS